jgi:dihydroneopterin aldolase
MTADPAKVIRPLRAAQPEQPTRRVFIRDMVLPCSIGVHKYEHAARQRVRINLDLAVREDVGPLDDKLSNVVCYEAIADGVRGLVAQGHVKLVETLADRIAALCLRDSRGLSVRVRVEKLDVFPDALSAGVEIERKRAGNTPYA